MTSGYVDEATLAVDNYSASQLVNAAFFTADLPFGSHWRANLGIRQEHGQQDVRTFDLFHPGVILSKPTSTIPIGCRPPTSPGSSTKGSTSAPGASRTLSRPDLNEMSPSPSLEYVGGYQVAGNPHLQRATLENYDVRFEAFPAFRRCWRSASSTRIFTSRSSRSSRAARRRC